MTYPPGDQPQFRQAPPYPPQGSYYARPGTPHFLPPEAGKQYARYDPVQPVRVLAGPGRRLGARLLDALIMLGVFFVLFFVIASIGRQIAPNADLGANGPGGVIAIILLILAGIAYLLYEPMFVWKKGGTPGKLLLGIRVVHVSDARYLGFGSALGRFFFPIVMGIIPLGALLNVLWLLWDRPLYQCLHDKVVGSVVVHAEGSDR